MVWNSSRNENGLGHLSKNIIGFDPLNCSTKSGVRRGPIHATLTKSPWDSICLIKNEDSSVKYTIDY